MHWLAREEPVKARFVHGSLLKVVGRENAWATVLAIYVVCLGTLPDKFQFATTVIMLLVGLVTRGIYLIRIVPFILPLLALFCLSAVMTLGTNADFVGIAKGVWYVSRPIIYFITAALLAVNVRNARLIMLALIAAGAVVSGAYLIKFFSDPNVFHVERTYIRRMIGKGSVLMPLSLSLAAFIMWKQRGKGGFIMILPVALALAAIILSQSRSLLVDIIFIMVALLGLLSSVRLLVPCIAVVLLAEFFIFTPLLSHMFPSSYIQHMMMSSPDAVNEMLAVDRGSIPEINAYWRGYETYTAYSKLFSHSPLRIWLGLGLGYQVPIPVEINLNNEPTTIIPVFHNAFSFLAVRGGIVGVLLYILQCCVLAFATARMNKIGGDIELLGRVGIGILLYVCFTTPTSAGLVNYGCTAIMLLGLAIGASVAEPRIIRI